MCAERKNLIIGGGPAGLMAADILSAAGQPVLLADAMPSLGRKLLMAGKSGLNLTKDEPPAAFAAHVSPQGWLEAPLAGFGPAEVQDWTRGLGQDVFTGTSGRVFPRAMKASPLLRAWLGRLAGQGVAFRTRWRWVGLDDGAFRFETPEGLQVVRPEKTILALGGASWPRLGSTGSWVDILRPLGVNIAPFRPANMGFRRQWSAHMARHFGQPVKPLRLIAGEQSLRGEVVISCNGVEGGGLYPLASRLLDGAALHFDLVPDLDVETIAARLGQRRKGDSLTNHLRKALRLEPVKLALLQECARPLPNQPGPLAALIKALPVPLDGPYPMEQAISTSGGIARNAVDDTLQLRALPGVYVAGEMLDWDAPTGGYLLTTCLATGRWVGQAARDGVTAP